MLYSEFKNKKLSLLGMGCMRLPTNENGKIDITEGDSFTVVRLTMLSGRMW